MCTNGLADVCYRHVFRFANTANLVGACGHGWATVKNVDIVFPVKPLILQHPHCRTTRWVRHANDGFCAFLKHRYIYGMLGHEVGDKLVAELRIELVGFLKAHAKKAPSHAVPERRAACFINNAA